MCAMLARLSSASLSERNDREYRYPTERYQWSLLLLTVCMLTVFTLFAVQPMKLGEHLNSLLLNMCDDVTLSRMSLRTVLDICSKHIRNSSCDPPFSYIRKLVRLVLGSLSQVSIFLFNVGQIQQSNFYIFILATCQ